MRRYDDPVEVHRGLVAGQEAPDRFWWRGRCWVVRAVVAHWLETGAWWEQSGVAAMLGAGHDAAGVCRDVSSAATRRQNRGTLDVSAEGELLAEREMWRLEATRSSPYSDVPGRDDFDIHGRDLNSAATRRQNRGILDVSAGGGFGVFELGFDWASGEWRLARCLD